MKKRLLKINHVIFFWYYRSCGDHFRQYTFFRSVSLLIQNYKHLSKQFDSSEKHLGEVIRTNTKLSDEISSLKMQMIADQEQIKDINKTFGTKFLESNKN
jgi:regulator of replication initiation timing